MQTVQAQNCYRYNKPYTNTMYTITSNRTQSAIWIINSSKAAQSLSEKVNH